MGDRNRPGAVILGGSFNGLGAARNLTKNGVPVYIVDTGLCVTQFSRHVRRFFKCPLSNDDTAFVDFLLQLAEKANLSGCVLFPSDDEGVRIFAQHRERLSEHYYVALPPWDVVKFVYDKRLTYLLAKELEIPIPETYNPSSVSELESLDLDFPLILKPAITTHFISVTKKKAYRADEMRDLIDLYGKMAEIIDPAEILVQELIPGRAENLFSFVGFFKNGVPVSGLSARRPRQHPMELGRASTFVETVNAPELEALATKFLQGIGYSGLAEVEFMYDEKDACYKLLEVNPRFWGWHTIAIRAGLDLPYIAYADAIGQKVTVGEIREGVKWVRLLTDIPTAVLEILGGRLTVRRYLTSLSGDTECAVLSLSDPLPFLADLLLLPRYIKRRGF